MSSYADVVCDLELMSGSAAGSSGNSTDSTGESSVLSRTPTSIAEAPFDTGDFRDISPLPEIADFGPGAKRELLPQPVGQTPLDVIPPIYDPQFVAPAESGLDDGELVMGVSINGESRAYPVGIMRFREVVNDDVGGVPVLVTWCPICFTGLVHDRRLEGTTYTFGNYGTLFMNAMTWWDHETESVWSQPWGAAIEGELSGARLTLLPYDLVPWSTWREQHPDTLALADGRKYIKFDEYSSREGFVIGVSIGNAAKGFYFRSLLNTGVINDSVGEYPIAVFADSVTRDIDVFIRTPRGESAEAIEAPGMLAFKINQRARYVTRKPGVCGTSNAAWLSEARCVAPSCNEGPLSPLSTGPGKTLTRIPPSGGHSKALSLVVTEVRYGTSHLEGQRHICSALNLRFFVK